MKSTMTETVLSWDHGGAAAAMAQNAQMTEEHSTLGQQTPGRLDHPAWCVVLTVWPASTWKHYEDADVNLRQQLRGGSQQGMTAPCQQGNDTREHIAGTEFSLELSTSVVHGGVELCALTSLRRTRDERRRWRQIAAVVTVIRKCPRELSCSNPPLSPQVRELMTIRWCVSTNDACYVFDGVLQNTIWRLQWREHSW